MNPASWLPLAARAEFTQPRARLLADPRDPCIGTMTFDNGDKFTGGFCNEAREGQGCLELGVASSGTSNIQNIGGVYHGDRLQGKGKIEYRNGDVLYGW